jgi:hypothetical protein
MDLAYLTVVFFLSVRYYHQKFFGGISMNDINKRLNAYIETHPFNAGDSSCETVLEQLYQAYSESHESDPAEISHGFKELEFFLHTLPLADNDAVFNLCCRLCIAYERQTFVDGLQYGVHFTNALK